MIKPDFESIENISAYDYYKFYLRNSRLFGVVWFFLSICFTISLIIIFISPEWIGDTSESPKRGYFGLYKFCEFNFLTNSYECFGSWTNFNSLPNSPAVKAACFFIGFALIVSILSLLVTVFCFLVKYERIFHVCAWFQFVCTISLLVGILVYPVGWNIKAIRSVCGEEANQFKIGSCSMRWPYLIAIISQFQIFFLTILSFLLAARQAKFLLMYASQKRFENNNIYGQQMQHPKDQIPYMF